MMNMATPHKPLSAEVRWYLAGLILLIGMIQFGTLSYHSLWNDEFITLKTIMLGYPEMIQNRLANSHVPGYFIFLKAWTGWVGLSETALRFPSALSAFIGILLIWRLGAWLYGERIGILVLALAGLNQVQIEQGNNARMYATLYLAYALALSALVRYLDTGAFRHLAWLVFAGMLGMSMHLLYAFVPIAAGIYLYARRSTFPDRWRRALFTAAIPLILTLPTILLWSRSQNKLGNSDELGEFALTDALRQTFIMFTGDYHALDNDATQYLGIALAAVALIVATREVWLGRRVLPAEDHPQRHTGLLLAWIFTPMIAIAVGQLFSRSSMAGNARYYVMEAAAAPLLIAAVMLLLRNSRPAAAHAFAGIFMFLIVLNSAAHLISPGTGLREVAHYISERIDFETEDIVVSRDRHRTYTFVHYGGFERLPDSIPEDIDATASILEWLRRRNAEKPRMWAVFYDRLDKDKLYKTVRKHPEVFQLVGEQFIHGETGVGLYELDFGAAPLGEGVDSAQ